MCNLALLTSSPDSLDSIASSSMHSQKQNSSVDEQQQELNPDTDENKVGPPRATTPSSLTGTRSDVDSPVRSYALIETDPTELDRIIDILRQFFPNTRIVECNNSSSNPSRTPSRSSLVAAAPQQQTSIESNSSLYVYRFQVAIVIDHIVIVYRINLHLKVIYFNHQLELLQIPSM